MRIRIKSLKGLNINEIKGLVNKFYNDVLKKIENEETFEFLDALIKCNKNIIILSNTFNFILESFPQKNHIKKLIGSEILIENSILQGKYKRLVNQTGKLNIIKEFYSYEDIKNSMFLTDNIRADSDLFNYVNQPILILK